MGDFVHSVSLSCYGVFPISVICLGVYGIVLVSSPYFPVVRYSVPSCFVLRFVVYIFPYQSTGGEFVLFFRCLAVYDGSFEAGVVFDVDVVSFFSCIDARLFCDAFVGGVCGVCLFPPLTLTADPGV